jgi:hypothetical protein
MPSDDLRLWPELGWDRLRAWGGAASLAQARQYLERVSEVASHGSEVVGWVDGRDRYAVRVRLVANPEVMGGIDIDSHCSCPVGRPCKHAVALILVAQRQLEAGLRLGTAAPDDPRLAVVAKASDSGGFLAGVDTTSSGHDWPSVFDSLGFDDSNGQAEPLAYLSREQLLAVLVAWRKEHPEFMPWLVGYLARLSNGS